MPAALPTRFDQLIDYFNRRVLDVPDGFFDRNARFTLNGRTFEEMLGRSGDDPLIRMIARGVAGYRFAAKPLLHALDPVLVTRTGFTREDAHARATLTLRGTLRGSGALLEETLTIDLTLDAAEAVLRADVMLGEKALDRIRVARAS